MLTEPKKVNVSLYSTVRGKISDLICDQELVMSGPPFNPLIDLDELSHEKFVDKASEGITPFNPEGHPPPGVYSPTMKNLARDMKKRRWTVVCIDSSEQFTNIILFVSTELQRISFDGRSFLSR